MDKNIIETLKEISFGIPIEEIGNRINELNDSLEKHNMYVSFEDDLKYGIETQNINGSELATAINLRVFLFQKK